MAIGTSVTLTIDGRKVTVPKGTTVWHAAKHLGIDIPVFCYHDRMPPLGACRQCLVRVEKIPRLQTSCTLIAEDGMTVHATSPDARAAQEEILEYLLINHPLDCPICDKGGECPLQDQAFHYGPGRSRFVEAKRDFAKPVSLGPILVLDRERCVLCWRCVRFGEIVAGDDALKGFDRGFGTEIDTPFSQPIRSKFIGNTIAICPVGALTSKAYRFLARPWDNRPVASACNQCGLGCSIWVDVRGDAIARVRARENPALNDIWLCDLGQFGYEFVGAEDRLTHPLVRTGGRLRESTWEEALSLIAARLEAARRADPASVAAIGGGRLTNEDAFLAARFFREIVGTPHLDHRLDTSPVSPSLRVTWGLRTPLGAVAQADVLLLAGCDITEEYPVAWLRMRQAINRGARAFAIHAGPLEITQHLSERIVPAVGAEGLVLGQVAAAATGDPLKEAWLEAAGVDPAVVRTIGETVRRAARPMIFVGRSALDGATGEDALEGARRLEELGAAVHIMRGKGNAAGAALVGFLPGAGGWTGPEIVRAAGHGRVEVLYVLGSDPATDVPDAGAWTDARAHTPFLVVHDLFLTTTARQADVVLPVLAYAETDGTVANLEGRIQRIERATRGPGQARADGAILLALARRLGAAWAFSGWEEVFDDARASVPGLQVGAVLTPAPVASVQAAADRETNGARAGPPSADILAAPDGTRDLILLVGDVLFDRGSMTSRAPRIIDAADLPCLSIHPDDAGPRGVHEGEAVEVASARGRLVTRARVTSRIQTGRVFLPRGFDALPVNGLLDWTRPVVAVTVTPLTAPALREPAAASPGRLGPRRLRQAP